MPEELVQALQEEAAADDMMYEKTAPQGQFTLGAMNQLMESAEGFANAAGMDIQLGRLGKADVSTTALGKESVQMPPSLMRILQMAKKMLEDAVDANVVDPDRAFTFDGVNSDTGLRMLATKLDLAQEDRGFRRWLSEAPEETPDEEAGEEPAPEEQPEEDVEAYLASRV